MPWLNVESCCAPDSSVSGATNLINYSQKMIGQHTEIAILTESRAEDERTFHDILQRQILDESGVNLEEEMANLIMVQTHFSASARTVTAVDEMFQELLSII